MSELETYKAKLRSCTCMTKTPELQYHKESCNYQILSEAGTVVTNVQKLTQKLEEMKVAGLRISTSTPGAYLDTEKLAGEMLWIIEQFESGNTKEYVDY
jgi:hypothetical protein